MSGIRSRWSAVGAAVAITLGAGGIGLVSATEPNEAVTFVPITPCRLFDTRPDFQVGSRGEPLGPGDIHTVDATGSNGNCTDIPAEATAVSMNMTSTDAIAPTFLTVWATGETQPEASSMNPVPGAPAVPNGIISALNGDGEFSIFNLAGSVHVLADINGYYVDHNHDDRYYTKAQVEQLVPVEVSTEFGFYDITNTPQRADVTLSPPGEGTVIATASCWLDTPSETETVFTLGQSTGSSSGALYEYADNPAGTSPIYWSNTFPVSGGQTWTVSFTAGHFSGGGSGQKDCDRGVLTARWVPPAPA